MCLHVSLCTDSMYSCVLQHFTGRCNNVQAADIVFLVDGSSSIGRLNFLQVKGFMAGIVKPFASSVSESGIRFGAIQYSDTSRWLTGLTFSLITPLCMQWQVQIYVLMHISLPPGLNLHLLITWMAPSSSTLCRISTTRVETHALVLVSSLLLITSSTLRPVGMSQRSEEQPFCDVSWLLSCILNLALPMIWFYLWPLLIFQITILITDGKSQDNVQDPAQKLRSQGVHVFAVGRCLTCSFTSLTQSSLLMSQCDFFFTLPILLWLCRYKECRQEWISPDLLPAQQWFHLLCWGLQTAEHTSSSCEPPSVFQGGRSLC